MGTILGQDANSVPEKSVRVRQTPSNLTCSLVVEPSIAPPTVEDIRKPMDAHCAHFPGVAMWATTHLVVFQSVVVVQIPVEQCRPC